jgi:hypothetical protein
MEPSDLKFLAPWERVEEGHQLITELYKELPEGHILEGKMVEPIARRLDQDDVLFLVKEEKIQYALVHLTWTGHQEKDKKWPHAVLYPDLETWIEQCYKNRGAF